jgi:hypothetical protein
LHLIRRTWNTHGQVTGFEKFSFYNIKNFSSRTIEWPMRPIHKVDNEREREEEIEKRMKEEEKKN